jgi:hypothetical protein
MSTFCSTPVSPAETHRQEIADLQIEIAERQARLRHLIMAAQQAGEMRQVGIVCVASR